jgi:hypothetical protein
VTATTEAWQVRLEAARRDVDAGAAVRELGRRIGFALPGAMREILDTGRAMSEESTTTDPFAFADLGRKA